MLADLVGKPIAGVTSVPTARGPKALVADLAARITRLLAEHPEIKGVRRHRRRRARHGRALDSRPRPASAT
jgi:hypothetical protein